MAREVKGDATANKAQTAAAKEGANGDRNSNHGNTGCSMVVASASKVVCCCSTLTTETRLDTNAAAVTIAYTSRATTIPAAATTKDVVITAKGLRP